MKKVVLDPITRVEGHLGVHLDIESNRVMNAWCAGEMFRGFETILKGRDPLDAQQITQRICGVCPVSHGMASVLAQDAIYSSVPPENGRLGRNLIQAANYLQSHILHFYHLAALDFIDIKSVVNYKGTDPQLREIKTWIESQTASGVPDPAAPFLPRYSGNYIDNHDLNILAAKHYSEALGMRALAHKMAAVFGGKIPHVPALVPGGITEKITADKIASYKAMLKKLHAFIETAYVPDVLEVAKAFPDYMRLGKGCGNFLSQGAFPESASGETLLQAGVIIAGKSADFDYGKITEEVAYSYYAATSSLKPAVGETVPSAQKENAYSWVKAPRYDREVVEVGPLARTLVACGKGRQPVKELVDQVVTSLNCKPDDLVSVMGRHAARAIECRLIARRCEEWIEQLKPGEPSFLKFEVPSEGSGVGLTEAPRGALGHWVTLQNGKIDRYQCVVPTTWNCSPRDDKGTPGPVEQALVGTSISDPENPIEAARIVRSFDPCIACAVH